MTHLGLFEGIGGFSLAKARGHKPVSAMYKFFKEAGRPSTSEINYIAKRLGFSEAWVRQQAAKV